MSTDQLALTLTLALRVVRIARPTASYSGCCPVCGMMIAGLIAAREIVLGVRTVGNVDVIDRPYCRTMARRSPIR